MNNGIGLAGNQETGRRRAGFESVAEFNPQYEHRISNSLFPVMFGEFAIILWLIIMGGRAHCRVGTQIGQQTLEIDFLKGCLQRIEEQRMPQASIGNPQSTARSFVIRTRRSVVSACASGRAAGRANSTTSGPNEMLVALISVLPAWRFPHRGLGSQW